MNSVINSKRLYLYILPFFLIFSLLSGIRPTKDFSIDTTSYINFFQTINNYSYKDLNFQSELIEPGFVLLTFVISRFTNDYHLYLSLVFILFNSFLFLFWKKLLLLLKIRNSEIFLVIIIGFTLSSNWYNNFSYNGLRQGIAAPLLYIGILYLIEKKYLKSFLFILLALSFHKSILFVIIFFPILFFKKKYTILSYIFLGFIYLFNFSEILVFKISEKFNIPIYALISEYGGEDAMYKGFSITFFLYSFLLVPSIYFVVKFYNKYFPHNHLLDLELLLKIYTVLIGPYFLLGYSGFSNRYAIYGWFFIPVIYSINLFNLRIDKSDKILLILLIFFFSIYKNLVIYF
jgi:hypothetical protein